MKKAFTLLEVLISLLLMSVIMSALFLVMSSGRTTWYATDTRISLQQDLRKAMRQMLDDLRQSGSSQISLPADGNNYTSVSFNVSEGAGGSGAINWNSSPINFSLSGGQILRTDGSTTRVLANNITGLTFLRQVTTPKIVRINMTAQRTSAFRQLLNASLDSAAMLRN